MNSNIATLINTIRMCSARILQPWSQAFSNQQSVPARRADLDLLRIVLFGLLIIHHVGMFYTANWGWHGKSQYQWQWLESVLLIVEPWRMPAIWFISGVAIRFLLAKSSTQHFLALRTHRLLLPLLFGVLVIVPPQLYVEMSQKGETAMNYWQFLHAFFQAEHPAFASYQYGIWPHIDVNHLWYLRSLWYYTLTLVALLPLLHSKWLQSALTRLNQLPAVAGIIALLLPVLLIQLFWEINNTRYPLGCYFLFSGYLLAWNQHFWRGLANHHYKLLISFGILTVSLLVLYNTVWLKVIHEHPVASELKTLVLVVYSSTRIAGLLTILMLAARLAQHLALNNNSAHHKRFRYWQEAVYPFYLVHQSVILVVGYQLTQWNLGGFVECVALLLLTFGICWLIFSVIRRIDPLRPLFGLKTQNRYAPFWYRLGYLISAIAILPLLLRLL